jgi:opacity protein-like surface antigen
MSFRSLMQICGGIAALGLAGVAHAQVADTPPDQPTAIDEQPPPEAPPATMPDEQPAPGSAAAMPAPPPPPAPMPPPPVEHARQRHESRVFAPHQVSLTTGAGVANYFGSADPGDTVDAGAMWDARLTVGARSVIALEAAYMGGVNNVDIAGGAHGQLFSNGFDGDLRLQLPTRVQPYVFGGVGYNHMEVRNRGLGFASDFVGHDDQVTIPAGGGLTGYVGRHITLDLRGTYRFIPDNGITIMRDHNLHQWIAQAHVGYAF